MDTDKNTVEIVTKYGIPHKLFVNEHEIKNVAKDGIEVSLDGIPAVQVKFYADITISREEDIK